MLVIALLMLGITTPLWGTVGLLRRIGELHNQSIPNQLARHHAVFPNRLAVFIAAHSEELVIVIAETIASAEVLVLASNLPVTDGSTNATSVIAEAEGVNCLEPHPHRGKAGALAAGPEYYYPASDDEVIPPLSTY